MNKHWYSYETTGDQRAGLEAEQVLVAFEYPAMPTASTVSVCGDFNGWQPESNPLTRLSDGRFRTQIALPAGARHRFRYLVDGQRWENDPTADDYVPNEFGTNDGVVDLTELPSLPVMDTGEEPSAVSEEPSAVSGAGMDSLADVDRIDIDIDHEVQPGLQRIRLRREIWELIVGEAAVRDMAPEDFMAYLLDAAVTAQVWSTIA